MSQNSLVVSNGTGAAVRSAVNNALDTLKTHNSGASAPGTTSAYMLWVDTTNDLLKIRNAANSAWISIGKPSQANLGLSAIPRGLLWGMTLSNNGTDATNDIDVAAGLCASDDAADVNRVLLNPGVLTKQLDVAWAAGTAAGGRISSEGLVNGTWHVYAFRRSGGADDVCFSQSLTPTLPDGGTNKRRIGSVLRESAAIVAFVQDGDQFSRKTPVLDYNATNPGTAAVTVTLSVPVGVALLAQVHASIGITLGVLLLSDLSVPDNAPSSTAAPLGQIIMTASLSSQMGAAATVRTNSSAQIRSRVSNSDANQIVRIASVGWVDARGRDN